MQLKCGVWENKNNVWSIILREHSGWKTLLREVIMKKWRGNGGVEKEKYFIPNFVLF